MELIFCCKDKAKPYKPCSTDHEHKFQAFYEFANGNLPTYGGHEEFAIQFTKQVNFTPITETKYFVFNDGRFRETHVFGSLVGTLGTFVETNQAGLANSGYRRANSYKNYKCCNYFYEVNLYTKSGMSRHHLSTVEGVESSRDSSHDF